MTALVESLKRLYENGKRKKSPKATKTQIKERVKRGTINAEEYRYITGEEYKT